MKQCYGKMYPDLSRIQVNRTVAGKVFRYRVGSAGLVNQAPVVEFDMAAWEECRSCDAYRDCYDLSNAMLAMRNAVRAS